MAPSIPLLEGRREGGQCLCTPPLEKRRRVAMFIPIPLPEGIWEGGHDPCPSSLDKWQSEVMATLHPSSRRKEGRMPLSMPPSS